MTSLSIFNSTVTPENYQPMFYRDLKEEVKFTEHVSTVKLGSVTTKYNQSFFKAKSSLVKRILSSSDAEEVSILLYYIG